MKRRSDTVRYTVEEIDAMLARGDSRSDWARVKGMTEEELEASIAADPDDVHIRIDADVLDWFKRTGRGYQTRINDVLRAFVESRRTPG